MLIRCLMVGRSAPGRVLFRPFLPPENTVGGRNGRFALSGGRDYAAFRVNPPPPPQSGERGKRRERHRQDRNRFRRSRTPASRPSAPRWTHGRTFSPPRTTARHGSTVEVDALFTFLPRNHREAVFVHMTIRGDVSRVPFFPCQRGGDYKGGDGQIISPLRKKVCSPLGLLSLPSEARH
jgi:hypothetical protein